MSSAEQTVEKLGLVLPVRQEMPGGRPFPFALVNVRGRRASIAGHGPLEADGSLAEPLGKVGRDVTLEQATELARKTGLAMLGSLKAELGDLDRIAGWVKVFGMVNSDPGFNKQPLVINGCTELILEVFGPEVGRHSRSAVGMASLPFDIAVEIEAEVILKD